jgi:glycosyltransferase involved in cell wall biosynthesis
MMPLVVLEAMASGIPAVVTNVSGSQDLVLDGRTGYVVEPGDEHAMAERLLAVLDDAGLRSELAGATSARALDFGWDSVSRRYLALADSSP